MTDETRYALIQKEIDTYQYYIDAIPSILKVLKQFDGKVVNVKIENALKEEFDKEGKAHVRAEREGWCYKIKVFICDDYVAAPRPLKACVGTLTGKTDEFAYFIQNRQYAYAFKIDECFTKTENDRYRIDYTAMEDRLTIIAMELTNRMNDLKNGIQHVEEMQEAARQLQKMYDDYQNEYSYRIKELFDCNFSLRRY